MVSLNQSNLEHSEQPAAIVHQPRRIELGVDGLDHFLNELNQLPTPSESSTGKPQSTIPSGTPIKGAALSREERLDQIPDSPKQIILIQEHIENEMKTIRESLQKIKIGSKGWANEYVTKLSTLQKLQKLLLSLFVSPADTIRRMYISLFIDRDSQY